MKSVSRFESNLLRILRGCLGSLPSEQVLPLVYRELPRPRCLSRDAVELVQETLAKGCVRRLALGGWRRERFLNDERAVTGRLWERIPLDERRLEFSRGTLEFLVWLTAENPAVTKRQPRIATERLTPADRLLPVLMADVLGPKATAGMIRWPAFASNGLLWLGWPERAIDVLLKEPPDFNRWMTADSVWALEALQPALEQRWIQIELEKQQTSDFREVRRIGEMQTRVLDAYFDALEQAGRWDLARFIVGAAKQILRTAADRGPWFGRLDLAGLRLADRTEVYRAGFALLHALLRLRQWERAARAVGFYDEGYAASQLWKSDWERWNAEVLCEEAERVVRGFELLSSAR